MRTLNHALRLVVAGLTLSYGVASAAPSDFTTDLAMTMAFVSKTGETAANNNTVKLNGTRQVKTTLSVPLGTVAQGITLDAVIPAGLTATAVTNCTPTAAAVTAGTKFPCTVADLTDGASKAVTTTLTQKLPADLADLPTTCDTLPPAYGEFRLTATTTTTDPDAANNTAAVTPVALPWNFADMQVTFTGPESWTPGSNATYHVTVTNNGPCTSTNVWIYSDAYGSAPFVDATWTCANTGGDFEVDGCQLGDIAALAVVEFDKTYFIPPMASDAIDLYHPNGVSLAGPTAGLLTPDFDADNNSDSLLTYVHQSVGCSTAGSGGPTGLLVLGAAVALLFRRRRSA